MATRLIGTDSDLPRLPALVIAATQGTTAADLAPGDVIADANTYTDTAIAAAQFDVRSFGAVGDYVADDTAAIQAAIDSVAFGDGVPPVTINLGAGTFRITNTLTINRRAVTLNGVGIGNPTTYEDNPGQGTTIVWDGAAGIPMINIRDSQHLTIRDLYLQGNDTNIPSEGIYFESAGGASGTNQVMTVDHVHFGHLGWPAGSNGTKLNYCVRFGGVNANNDQFTFRNCQFVNPANTCVKIDQSQSVWGIFENCLFGGGTTAKGLVTTASTTLINPQFNQCTVDVEIGSTAQVIIVGWQSEGSRKLAAITGNYGRLIARGGVVTISNVVGGYYITANPLGNTGCVDLEGMIFLYVGDSGVRPKLQTVGLAGGGYGDVRIVNCNLPAQDYELSTAATSSLRVNIDDSGVFDRTLLSGVATYTPLTVNGSHRFGGSRIGFYTATPVTRPTGVSATAALEALGLGSSLLAESGGVQVDVFDVVGTSHVWTKPAWATKVSMALVGGSGGGGSGRRGAAGSVRCGGGGSGGAAWTVVDYDAADLGATLNVVVGSGGTGGAAITVDDTNGTNGTQGGSCYVRSIDSITYYARTDPGLAGSGGTASAGTGGGIGTGLFAGGTGGTASTTGLVGVAGGHAQGGGGGGSGGGITTGNAASAGGAGGTCGHRWATQAAAGGAIGTAGTAPVSVVGASSGLPSNGCSGGGSSIAGAGGNGGDATAPGMAAGGGGASVNGQASGRGGNGYHGRVVITSYG